MKAKWNQTGRRTSFFIFRQPPGSALLQNLLLFSLLLILSPACQVHKNGPDEVQVEEHETDREILLQLHVSQADMGKVIGKQGRIAKAIRSVVKAASAKEEKKVTLDIE